MTPRSARARAGESGWIILTPAFSAVAVLATDTGMDGCCDKLGRVGWADEPGGDISRSLDRPPRFMGRL